MRIILSTLLLISLFSCSEKKESPKADAKKEVSVKKEMPAAIDAAVMARGKVAFDKTCIACHQATGLGVPAAFPPLAKSDYLMADRKRTIKQVIKGSQGEITVNGKKYNGVMPPQVLTEQEIADVLTYVMNSWGNKAEAITLEEVQAVKKSL